jgi:hypothetical protein
VLVDSDSVQSVVCYMPEKTTRACTIPIGILRIICVVLLMCGRNIFYGQTVIPPVFPGYYVALYFLHTTFGLARFYWVRPACGRKRRSSSGAARCGFSVRPTIDQGFHSVSVLQDGRAESADNQKGLHRQVRGPAYEDGLSLKIRQKPRCTDLTDPTGRFLEQTV